MDKFYVQMDSFSRQLVHDYEGVMTKIAQLGYNGVEIFYGLHGGYTAEGLKKFSIPSIWRSSVLMWRPRTPKRT